MKVKEDVSEEEEEGEEGVAEKVEEEEFENDPKKGATPWPEADMLELFSRMEAAIPPDDSLTYSKRTEHLDWNEVNVRK